MGFEEDEAYWLFVVKVQSVLLLRLLTFCALGYCSRDFRVFVVCGRLVDREFETYYSPVFLCLVVRAMFHQRAQTDRCPLPKLRPLALISVCLLIARPVQRWSKNVVSSLCENSPPPSLSAKSQDSVSRNLGHAILTTPENYSPFSNGRRRDAARRGLDTSGLSGVRNAMPPQHSSSLPPSLPSSFCRVKSSWREISFSSVYQRRDTGPERAQQICFLTQQGLF